MTSITNEVPPSDEPDRGNTAGAPLPSAWKRVRRSVWGRVAAGFAVGGSVGSCWFAAQTEGGLHLRALPMAALGWFIATAMWLPGGKLPWRFGLPAAAVTVAVCLFLDFWSTWSVYYTQTGYLEDFSALTAFALFPSYWRPTYLFAYALAAAVAYVNSYDRASWRRPRRPEAIPEVLGEHVERVANLADKVRQPAAKRGLPSLVLAGLILLGLMTVVGAALLARCRYSVREMALSPDGDILAVAPDHFASTLIWHEFSTGQTVEAKERAPQHILWSADGQRLLGVNNSGSDNGRFATFVEFRRLGSVPVFRSNVPHEHFRSLAYSPNGRILATGSTGGDVLLWTPKRIAEPVRLEGQVRVTALAFSPTGNELAAGLSDGHIVLWDVETRQPIRSWPAHDEVHRLLFAPDGAALFSLGRLDGMARAWDVAAGAEIHAYRVEADWLTSMALSPDGQALAVAGGSFHRPGAVRVFDVATARPLHFFTVAANTVTAVAFSADGRTLFAGTRPPIDPLSRPWHGRVHRWDLTTGRELPPLH